MLDITFDLETCSLSSNAAIIQIGAVVWNRAATNNPFRFSNENENQNENENDNDNEKAAPTKVEHESAERTNLELETRNLKPETRNLKPTPTSSLLTPNSFTAHIDLRSCISAGLDFDQETVKFWANQKEDVKQSVLLTPTSSLLTVSAALDLFLCFIDTARERYNADRVCLWSQGSDFDISILRNLCAKFGYTDRLNKLVGYQNFRDARTYILEAGRSLVTTTADIKPRDIYNTIPPMPPTPNSSLLTPHSSPLVHDAFYDAKQTSWSVWNVMKLGVRS